MLLLLVLCSLFFRLDAANVLVIVIESGRNKVCPSAVTVAKNFPSLNEHVSGPRHKYTVKVVPRTGEAILAGAIAVKPRNGKTPYDFVVQISCNASIGSYRARIGGDNLSFEDGTFSAPDDPDTYPTTLPLDILNFDNDFVEWSHDKGTLSLEKALYFYMLREIRKTNIEICKGVLLPAIMITIPTIPPRIIFTSFDLLWKSREQDTEEMCDKVFKIVEHMVHKSVTCK